MDIPLKELLNYKESRYDLAKAAIEYAKKVRYTETQNFKKMNNKESAVSINSILKGKIKFTKKNIDLEDNE